MTTRCAGGCGDWLVVGTLAERRHRTLWCLSCYARHLLRCGACQDREAVPAFPPTAEPVLF